MLFPTVPHTSPAPASAAAPAAGPKAARQASQPTQRTSYSQAAAEQSGDGSERSYGDTDSGDERRGSASQAHATDQQAAGYTAHAAHTAQAAQAQAHSSSIPSHGHPACSQALQPHRPASVHLLLPFDDLLGEMDQSGADSAGVPAPTQGYEGLQRGRQGCLGTRICPAYINRILQQQLHVWRSYH